MVAIAPTANYSSPYLPISFKREDGTPAFIKKEDTPAPAPIQREDRLIPAVSPAPEGMMHPMDDFYPQIFWDQLDSDLLNFLRTRNARERREFINVRFRSRSLLSQERQPEQERPTSVRRSLPRSCKVVKQQQQQPEVSVPRVARRLILNPPRAPIRVRLTQPRPPVRLRLTQPRPPVRLRLTQPRPPLKIRFPANVVSLTIMTRSRTAGIQKAKAERIARSALEALGEEW